MVRLVRVPQMYVWNRMMQKYANIDKNPQNRKVILLSDLLELVGGFCG